jgi:transcriptional regulator with AAA-type ATPase domain
MTTSISVSWVSVNNDPYERHKDGSYIERDGEKTPGPTLEFLFNSTSPARGSKKHYLLVRRPKQKETGGRLLHPREADVAEELRNAIAERSGAPEVKTIWWDTDAPPTDHRELFLFTAHALTSIRREHPHAKIRVNISPGTPAAQTAMLLALQFRMAGDHVFAFQGTPRDKRGDGSPAVVEVPWNLLAELAATPTEEADPASRSAVWSIEHARSARLREVGVLVKQYAGVPFPVLIMGARGTGKSKIAESLRMGFREWTAQVPTAWDFHLNCAEFRGDANMLRSALFGYAKGAHSLAFKEEKGLLEKAAGDCVFLDEIHWMDPQAQGLLLLALQRNGKIRPIGGDKSAPSKFRLIAATNQPRSILREKLTPDFLDRVSDLVIELPELRDCRDDLGDIWRSVVRAACEELDQRDPVRAGGSGGGRGQVDSLASEFQPHQAKIEKALTTMRLPGNFRDLEKLARRLLVGGLARARFLSLSDGLVRAELERLRKEEQQDTEQGAGPAASLLDELPTLARCEEYLREVRAKEAVFRASDAIEEWECRILEAASKVSGSGAKAAELLGMRPRTFTDLYKKRVRPK